MKFRMKILLKIIFTFFAGKRTKLINDRLFNRVLYLINFGKMPNLTLPKTFSEHLIALKLSSDNMHLEKYSDKWNVKSFIEDSLGSKYLIETYGVYDSYDEICFEELPEKFVLKCNHGSSFNIIVTDKSRINHLTLKRTFNRWLKLNYYHKWREKNYKNIKPLIIAEKFLETGQHESLNELKIFCFKGEVGFIVDSHTNNGTQTTAFYKSDWSTIDCLYGYKKASATRDSKNNDLILSIAKQLSTPFDFVRIDLYEVNNNIYFSELTFYPGGGIMSFEPEHYNLLFGKLFEKER